MPIKTLITSETVSLTSHVRPYSAYDQETADYLAAKGYVVALIEYMLDWFNQYDPALQ